MNMLKALQLRILLLYQLPIGGTRGVHRDIPNHVKNCFKAGQALKGGIRPGEFLVIQGK